MKQTAACGVLVCMKTLPIAFCFAMLTAYRDHVARLKRSPGLSQ